MYKKLCTKHIKKKIDYGKFYERETNYTKPTSKQFSIEKRQITQIMREMKEKKMDGQS